MSAAVGVSQGWKLPFLYVSIPTCILSILVLRTTEDPPRAAQEITTQRRVSLDVQHPDFSPIVEHDRRGGSNDDNDDIAVPMVDYNRKKSIDELISEGAVNVPKYKAKASLQKMVRIHDILFICFFLTTTIIILTAICLYIYTHTHNKLQKDLFKIKTNILLFLQGIPGCVPWGIIFAFMTDYLHTDRGATIMQATSIIIAWNLGQLLIGQSLGGLLGQFMYNRSKPSLCWLMGITTMLGSIPMLYLINSPFHYTSFLFISFGGGAIASVTGANIKAVVLNCNVPEMRGVANGVFGLTDDLGRGFGPLLISGLETITGGRQSAFTVGVLFWLLCGTFICMISFTLVNDERNVQKHVASSGSGDDGVAVDIDTVGLLQQAS